MAPMEFYTKLNILREEVLNTLDLEFVSQFGEYFLVYGESLGHKIRGGE